MKTLHYSIIVISLIGINFFVSEDAYGCLGICPPITPPPHYAFPPITVQTNLENYSTGDNIVITGHVFNQTKDTPLMVKIFDPMRQLQFDKNVSVSSNGNYTWTLSTVDFWSFDASGNYTVLAQYGQVYAITNFNLNSTLTQYLYAQSPLWQFHNGMPAEDVHCHAGLSLIIRKENFAPACTHPITATNLILSGWALGTPPIKRFISSIDINGLQQNYTVGQPIDATVTYAGYWGRAWEPDVKIFDANDTQIWFNCPDCVTNDTILGGIPSIPSYGNFTYHVRDYNGHLPVINKTGTYTMVVLLANKTSSAEFTIVKSLMLHTSFEPCDTAYTQSNRGVAVLYMPANSTGKICATYHNPDSPTQSSTRVFVAKDEQQQASEIIISAYPNIVPTGNSTIMYTIKTGNQAGFYGMSFFCGSIPFAAGYDNKSEIILDDFPWLYKNDICLSQTNVFQITGLSGIHVQYVTKAHRG